MPTLKSISPLSLAKLQAVLLNPVGLLSGVVYAFGGTIYDFTTTGTLNYGTALAYLALIGHPIIFAVIGFLLGLLEAIIYNWLAKKFGGVDVDLKLDELTKLNY